MTGLDANGILEQVNKRFELMNITRSALGSDL
jgi:hypothetical protein